MQRYQQDLLSDNKNFAIQYVERTYAEQTMFCGHCHSHFEIYVQIKGKRRYFLKNSAYEIEAGDVVIIAPGVVHKTSNLDKDDYARMLIEFNEKYLRDLDSFLGGTEMNRQLEHVYKEGYFIYRNKEQKKWVIDKCLRLVEKDQGTGRLDSAKCRLMAAEFLLEILSRAFGTDKAFEVGSRYKISEILGYISENYNKDISLKETSEKFFLSYYYLSRLFKEVTGFTFVAYINIVRANNAKLLIGQTDKSLDAIAETVGFGSQKQFVRVFKSLYGISPSKYKTNLKRKQADTK